MCSSNDSCIPGFMIHTPPFPPVPCAAFVVVQAAVVVVVVVVEVVVVVAPACVAELRLGEAVVVVFAAARRSKNLFNDNTCLTELRHVPFAVWKNGKFRCI